VLGYISGMHIIDGVVRDVNADGRTQLSNLKQAQGDVESISNKLKEFDALKDVSAEIVALEATIAEQEMISRKVSECMALLGEIDSFNAKHAAYIQKMTAIQSTSEAALRKEFTDKLAAFGVCPLCGVEMTAESISKNTSHV
jgi:DNA-binding FrmR family transcriptional regulator